LRIIFFTDCWNSRKRLSYKPWSELKLEFFTSALLRYPVTKTPEKNVLLIKLAKTWRPRLEAPTGGAHSNGEVSISREFFPGPVCLQHGVCLLQNCSYHIHQRIKFPATAVLQRNGIEENMKADWSSLVSAIAISDEFILGGTIFFYSTSVPASHF